jgi:hypothetical protein
MNGFVNKLKPARHKVIYHTDLNVIEQDQLLGSFGSGEDVEYFEHLSQFASIVSKTILREPFVYDDLVKNDVEIFMRLFLKNDQPRSRLE